MDFPMLLCLCVFHLSPNGMFLQREELVAMLGMYHTSPPWQCGYTKQCSCWKVPCQWSRSRVFPQTNSNYIQFQFLTLHCYDACALSCATDFDYVTKL
jgi:hypothetical protein